MKRLKEDFQQIRLKDLIVYSLAALAIIAQIVMDFIGLYMHPGGELHQSLLTAYGLTLTFCGTVFGLQSRASSRKEL